MSQFLSATEQVFDFQHIPKAELHLHLGGSYPKEYVCSIATHTEQKELEQSLELITQGVDYDAAFHFFRLIAQIVNTEEKVQNGVAKLCESLEKDHVRYVEIWTGLKDLGSGAEGYLKAVLRGIEDSASSHCKANVVLSVQRSSTPSVVKETIDLAIKYRNQGVVGIDISGNSTVGQIDRIIPELMRAKKEGLAFTIHMGESPKETDQLLLLTLLEPKRIGHGVYLSDEAKVWILKHQIPLEVCLTSSVLVKMVDEYKQHPGFEMFRLNHPIVFSTDDPLLFSTTLSQELLRAHESGQLSIEEITQITERAFDYALDVSR